MTLPGEAGLIREPAPDTTEAFVELASVMRGLSAIFWGLPMSLLAVARHFLVLWPTIYDLLFPIVSTSLLLFGLSRLARWHPQERVWQRAVLLAQVLALLLVGFAPFLFLWSRAPAFDYYARAVLLMICTAFGFMVALTRVLTRLAAILPDETARADARLFHTLSTYVVLLLVGVVVTVYVRLSPIPLSEFLSLPRQPFGFGRQALLLLLVLVPVAMAMSVSWKLKEVVMAMVTSPRRLA